MTRTNNVRTIILVLAYATYTCRSRVEQGRRDTRLCLSTFLRALLVALFVGIPLICSCLFLLHTPAGESSVSKLVRRYGFPYEEHTVITDDGYILPVYRIPNLGKPPVILQHGLLDSASSWLVNELHSSLPYILHDQGFDVWLTSTRGMAKGHIHLRKSSLAYWDWSLDEIAEFDIPALVTHVLMVNGAKTLTWIGHSQGNMAVFAALTNTTRSLALRQQINFLGALAPVGNFEKPHARNVFSLPDSPLPLLQTMRSLCDDWIGRDNCLDIAVMDFARKVLFQPNTGWFCAQWEYCEDILVSVGGGSEENFSPKAMVNVFQRYPVESSFKNLLHFGQMDYYKTFRKFDYGNADGNMAKYGSVAPPLYSAATGVPTAMYYGVEDKFILAYRSAKFVEEVRLSGFLVDSHAYPDYGHADFVWGLSAHRLVYPRLISHIRNALKEPLAGQDPVSSPSVSHSPSSLATTLPPHHHQPALWSVGSLVDLF